MRGVVATRASQAAFSAGGQGPGRRRRREGTLLCSITTLRHRLTTRPRRLHRTASTDGPTPSNNDTDNDTDNDTETATTTTTATTSPVNASTILKALVDVVKCHGRALVSVYLVTEAVNFVANRAFHRLTNQIAMSALAIPEQAIGNIWWLSQNPELLANGSSYQALTASVFLIAFPVSVLIKAVQSAYFYYTVCGGDMVDDAGANVEEAVPRPENAFKPALGWVRQQFGRVWALAPSLFTVEFLVSLVVIPLQFASLLVFTLPLTLPIIMSMHVSLPAAIKRDIKGWSAVKESRRLMKPVQWQAAVPFVFIIVVQRMIDLGQGKIISSLPSRFFYELLEVPLGVLALGFGLSVLASVCRTSLPFVLFNMLDDKGDGDQAIQDGVIV